MSNSARSEIFSLQQTAVRRRLCAISGSNHWTSCNSVRILTDYMSRHGLNRDSTVRYLCTSEVEPIKNETTPLLELKIEYNDDMPSIITPAGKPCALEYSFVSASEALLQNPTEKVWMKLYSRISISSMDISFPWSCHYNNSSKPFCTLATWIRSTQFSKRRNRYFSRISNGSGTWHCSQLFEVCSSNCRTMSRLVRSHFPTVNPTEIVQIVRSCALKTCRPPSPSLSDTMAPGRTNSLIYSNRQRHVWNNIVTWWGKAMTRTDKSR